MVYRIPSPQSLLCTFSVKTKVFQGRLARLYKLLCSPDHPEGSSLQLKIGVSKQSGKIAPQSELLCSLPS